MIDDGLNLDEKSYLIGAVLGVGSMSIISYMVFLKDWFIDFLFGFGIMLLIYLMLSNLTKSKGGKKWEN